MTFEPERSNAHVLMREEERSKQTTKQSNTAHPRQSVTFPKKNELPRVGLEPTTLYTLDRMLYQYVQLIQIFCLVHIHVHVTSNKLVAVLILNTCQPHAVLYHVHVNKACTSNQDLYRDMYGACNCTQE